MLNRSSYLLACLGALLCLSVKAQDHPTHPASTAAHELTNTDVGVFFDGLVPFVIDRANIAGMVVCVVKDGKLLYENGYGYSDVATKKPVSPQNTLFRPGSISKLFTWTAVMQQVEQGKLDLDRDVNDYLDFKIPPAFNKPITLRNIMTHTAGFEETAKDLFVHGAPDVTSLHDYLVNHIPHRIFPPGTTSAYSNYATALAGYIVERASGKPFADYIAENIFKPLNMNHTTFVQPLPDNLKPLMSSGYNLASEPAKPFEFVNAFPAGSVSTSADDMSHFMLAHLQNGDYNGQRILREDTAKLMHARQFGLSPVMPAMALGFYEETRSGHRIFGHGGDTVYFHSDLHLMPDANLGIFMSFNSGGDGTSNPREELWTRFLDRYYPYSLPDAPAIASAAADAKAVAGYYESSRRSETTLLRVTELVGQLKVVPNEDGTISTPFFKDTSGQPRRYREIAPMQFRDVKDQDLVVFQKDSSGRDQIVIAYPFMSFVRVGLLRNQQFNYLLIGFALLVLLLTLIFWPIAAIVRRHYAVHLELSPAERRTRLLVRIVCLMDIVFVALWAGLLTSLSNPGDLNGAVSTKIIPAMCLGVIGTLGTLIALYNAFNAATDRNRWMWGKLWEGLIALSCLIFTWFVYYWHLIYFNLNF